MRGMHIITEPGQYSCSILVLDTPIFQAALVAMHAGSGELNQVSIHVLH